MPKLRIRARDTVNCPIFYHFPIVVSKLPTDPLNTPNCHTCNLSTSKSCRYVLCTHPNAADDYPTKPPPPTQGVINL